MTKVAIVKWSQNFFVVDKNPFFGPPYNSKITLKTTIFMQCFDFFRSDFLGPSQNWDFGTNMECNAAVTLQFVTLSLKKNLKEKLHIDKKFFIKQHQIFHQQMHKNLKQVVGDHKAFKMQR